MRIGALTSFALLGLLVGQAHAIVLPTYPVTLSTRDREIVIAAACSSYGVAAVDRISAVTYQPGSKEIHVSVRCKSHGTRESLAIAHHTLCSNTAGRWRCEDGYDVVAMPVSNLRVVSLAPGGVDLPTAIEVVRGALGVSVPPFHSSSLLYLQGTCRVNARAVVYSADYERFTIECDGAMLDMSRVCTKGRCDYFSEGAREVLR